MHDALPGPTHSWMHDIMRTVAGVFGHDVSEHLPPGMHFILHLILLWGPVLMFVVSLYLAWRYVKRRALARRLHAINPRANAVTGLPVGVYRFILTYSLRQQLILMAAGLVAMPVLYVTLELPKLIINNAIEADTFPVFIVGMNFDQLEYLFMLCMFFLAAVIFNGALKYAINVYKGGVGERLLRRLRLTIYGHWRRGRGSTQRAEVIPVVAQEVEPIGGFASDAFSLPVFQGGTFLTILVFMFVQDPVLGAAAVTLLPIQIAVIPRLQRRVNRLSRQRVAEVRRLGGELGAQAGSLHGGRQVRRIGQNLKRIEMIRRRIHRSKFFIKSLSNFLTALTPFFFYSIGGYLVIKGDLTLGALVAVLAAHKDFSAPLRELFRYYQSAEDVRIRYEEMLRFIAQPGIFMKLAAAIGEPSEVAPTLQERQLVAAARMPS